MGPENGNRERRRFLRLDLQENVQALDRDGIVLGRVEKVSAGGFQLRLNTVEDRPACQPGAKMAIRIVEPGHDENEFNVEIRSRDGDILGLAFLD